MELLVAHSSFLNFDPLLLSVLPPFGCDKDRVSIKLALEDDFVGVEPQRGIHVGLRMGEKS
jgi:hypothetical protein